MVCLFPFIGDVVLMGHFYSLERLRSWAKNSHVALDEDIAKGAKKTLREEAAKWLRRIDTTRGSGGQNVRDVP